MNKAQKKEEIDFMSSCFSKAQIALCANYQGLTVGQITKLRRDLHNSGSGAKVLKNTLARISAKQTFKDASSIELDKFIKAFDGPSLFIWSFEDAVAPTKILADFLKENEKLRIKGAWLEGAFVDENAVKDLAKLPGKKELVAKLLALMTAPATQLVRLINTPSTQVVRVIDEQRKKLEGK